MKVIMRNELWKKSLEGILHLMRLSRICSAMAAIAGLCTASIGSAQTPPVTDKTLYYIPHTHWEGAVFKTREEYLEMGLPHILQALALLKKYPQFKFTLDQVAYIKPFLERYPEEADSFRKFVREGRLEIVGGMDVMPDDVKPGGELFVRQMMYGKRWCREQLGTDVTVAWLVDTFGHHPQMPQLLKLAGYQSFWFCRGVPNDDIPTEFLWRGIDGTEIPAFWAAGFYGLFYGPPNEPTQFATFFRDRYNALNKHITAPERFGLAGVDVSEPEEYAPPLVAGFNAKPDRPFTIRYSVPSEFAKVVALRKNLPVLANDLNPIFPGTYSSRAELKQTTREIEARLLTAEKLSAISQWLGKLADDALLWRAWEPVLFNQTHDLASGVMTDHVYEDVRRGYDLAKKISGEITDASWEALAAKINTTGPGVPVIVFNALGWPRTDAAEVTVGFAEYGARDVLVTDPTGASVPAQIVRTERYGDGSIKEAAIVFMARDVPALGCTVFHVTPKRDAPAAASARGSVVENGDLRVTVDQATGAITSVFDKKQQWEALGGPANVVARQEDKGDLWELYHGLDGGSYIAGTAKQPVPTSANALLSNGFAAKDAFIVRGPVFSEIRVSHPFGTGSYSTRVRLYNGLRRVDILTDLVNNEKFVRYQALFPTSIKNGKNVQEIPFGSLERPNGIEFPAQQWADYSDGSHGLALLNAGMPGNLASGDTLMLSLMRSHTIGGYGFGGGFEPGMTSDSGYEIGRPLTFHYALVPHAGDWRQGAVYRDALELNHPMLVRKAANHPGTLPSRWGLIEISPPNVVLTTCKPGPNGSTVIRVYEAGGVATKSVKIKPNAKVLGANEANLLEDRGGKLAVRENALQFDLHPFEIKTILLRLGAAKK